MGIILLIVSILLLAGLCVYASLVEDLEKKEVLKRVKNRKRTVYLK
jgi:hypothetical protein